MKLERRLAGRALPPVAPAASVALIVAALILASGYFSADRGMLVLFAREEGLAGPPQPGAATFVKVLPDGSTLVNGEPTPTDRLLERVESARGETREGNLVLCASDDAPYAAMVGVLDLLSRARTERGLPPGRIALPTHAEVLEWVRRLGYDPFERRLAAP